MKYTAKRHCANWLAASCSVASCVVLAAALAVVPGASAQIVLTTIGAPTNVNYDAFDGSGFNPSPATGQLDSDHYRTTGMSDVTDPCDFGDTCAAGTDYGRGLDALGGVSTGGLYAFDVTGGGVIALGVQPGGTDFTPGTLTIRFVNNTGEDIMDFDISYDLWVNNDQSRANSWNTAWSTTDFSYVGIGTLDYTSVEVADANGFTKTDQDESVSLGAALPNGGVLYIQFTSDDVSGTGSRDEFAIRNLSITPFGTAPVEIATFIAAVDGDQALLTWTTASEDELNGFEVQRLSDGTYSSLGFVSATGGGSSYSFRSTAVSPGLNTFRLKSVNLDGTFEYSNAVQVAVVLPTSFFVGSVYPNPFEGVAQIDFAVQREQRVTVSVFDMTGRRVLHVYDGVAAANAMQQITIDSHDLPTGVYIVNLQGEYFSESKQVTLVR